jgi:hypothetical protein
MSAVRLAALAPLVLIAGCGLFGRGDSLGVDAAGGARRTIVPNRTVHLAPSVQVPVEGLLLGAAVLYFVDPLAPNWEIEQTALAADRYRLALRAKAIRAGGDGEAEQVFRRHAEKLARDSGRAGYLIVEYETGIESKLPFAQRVASGVVLLR